MHILSKLCLQSYTHVLYIEEYVPKNGHQIMVSVKPIKVKSSMARSLPVKNLLQQNVGSINNYLQ